MASEITILIADDHPIFRKGLMDVLLVDKSLKVIGEAADGESALSFLREHTVDIAILDVDMPNLGGLDVAKAARREQIKVDVIILTMYKEESIFNKALDLGVRGYVLKENAASDIVQGVRTVAEGKHYVSPTISDFLVRRSKKQTTRMKDGPNLELLSPTERKVLKLIAANKSTKEIAEELYVSPKTVENHRANICSKLDLHGSHALLRFVIDNKTRL
jgi:DNA-binding NarL/FixJ family response regulator